MHWGLTNTTDLASDEDMDYQPLPDSATGAPKEPGACSRCGQACRRCLTENYQSKLGLCFGTAMFVGTAAAAWHGLSLGPISCFASCGVCGSVCKGCLAVTTGLSNAKLYGTATKDDISRCCAPSESDSYRQSFGSQYDAMACCCGEAPRCAHCLKHSGVIGLNALLCGLACMAAIPMSYGVSMGVYSCVPVSSVAMAFGCVTQSLRSIMIYNSLLKLPTTLQHTWDGLTRLRAEVQHASFSTSERSKKVAQIGCIVGALVIAVGFAYVQAESVTQVLTAETLSDFYLAAIETGLKQYRAEHPSVFEGFVAADTFCLSALQSRILELCVPAEEDESIRRTISRAKIKDYDWKTYEAAGALVLATISGLPLFNEAQVHMGYWAAVDALFAADLMQVLPAIRVLHSMRTWLQERPWQTAPVQHITME